MNNTSLAPYAATLLRISLGVLALAHGLLKILVFTPAGTVGFFESLGLPAAGSFPLSGRWHSSCRHCSATAHLHCGCRRRVKAWPRRRQNPDDAAPDNLRLTRCADPGH